MHDCQGQLLRTGDRVTIEFEIAEITSNDPNYCNVHLKTVYPAGYTGARILDEISTNAGITRKVVTGGAACATPAPSGCCGGTRSAEPALAPDYNAEHEARVARGG